MLVLGRFSRCPDAGWGLPALPEERTIWSSGRDQETSLGFVQQIWGNCLLLHVSDFFRSVCLYTRVAIVEGNCVGLCNHKFGDGDKYLEAAEIWWYSLDHAIEIFLLFYLCFTSSFLSSF